MTNETVYIPAGNLSTNGQATVSARAVNYGTEGNIRAGDIYGACCRALIQVENSAFSGGQNERDFQAVAKNDISGVVNALSSQFQHTMQTTVSSPLSPDETLITPIPCTTTMHSDQAIATEATQVVVTLHKTCTPLSYDTTEFQHQAENIFAQDSQNRLGTDYSLIGVISTRITKTTIRSHNVLISLTCSGLWAHQFNTRFLSSSIAGKSIEEAKGILKRSRGIQNSGIQLEGFTDRIPKNPDRIHFVFLYETV